MECTSEILLNRNAIKNNINFIKQYVGENVKISSVVKADAYGHGIVPYVKEVERNGINHFSVFCYNEAIKVYKTVSRKTDIMIMGWIGENNFKDVIKKGIEFFVFNTERLETALKAAKDLNIKAKLHLEVETGMNRNGLSRKEFTRSLDIIKNNRKYIKLKGLCSHLAGAESIANHNRVLNQIRVFENYVRILSKNDIYPDDIHLACSAAAICYPKSRFNMIRAGIIQYGFWPSKEVFLRYASKKKDFINPLMRVISWKSEIMSIKNVKTGKFISYGTSFLAQSNIKIAIIPVGYSNGYNRSLSNRGRVLIRGMRCPVIGLVNMNMIIVDVTEVEEVKVKDEVVLIGDQGDLSISVDSFSEISQNINYEILSRLPVIIPRKLI